MATRRGFFQALATTSLGVGLGLQAATAARAATSPTVRQLAPVADFEALLQKSLDELDTTGGDIQLSPGIYNLAKPLTLSR